MRTLEKDNKRLLAKQRKLKKTIAKLYSEIDTLRKARELLDGTHSLTEEAEGWDIINKALTRAAVEIDKGKVK